jgi:hypothetical protein
MPRRPLARRLAHSAFPLPLARCRVAEHGLELVSPIDKHAIARKGGWCLIAVSPATVESSL